MSSYLSLILERCLILHNYIIAGYIRPCDVVRALILIHYFDLHSWLCLQIFETLSTLHFIRHLECDFGLKQRLLNFDLRWSPPVNLVQTLLNHLAWHVFLWACWNLELVEVYNLKEVVWCKFAERVIAWLRLFLRNGRVAIGMAGRRSSIILGLR